MVIDLNEIENGFVDANGKQISSDNWRQVLLGLLTLPAIMLSVHAKAQELAQAGFADLTEAELNHIENIVTFGNQFQTPLAVQIVKQLQKVRQTPA